MVFIFGILLNNFSKNVVQSKTGIKTRPSGRPQISATFVPATLELSTTFAVSNKDEENRRQKLFFSINRNSDLEKI